MRVPFRVLSAALLAAALLSGCGPEKAGTNPDKLPGRGLPQEPAPGNPPPDEPPSQPPPDPGDTTPVPVPGPNHPDNARIDSDCDGLTDAEEWGTLYPGGLKTDPRLRDTDGDGLPDGREVGRTATVNTRAECTARFLGDADPGSRTHPARADTDGDGLRDGLEDWSRDGRVDPGETDPSNPDMDSDGLGDGAEDANRDGRVDPDETDPRRRDMDEDGLSDATELRLTGTDPRNRDTDGDTCPDGTEDFNGNGVKEPGETDPRNGSDCGPGRFPDSDGDGMPDHLEDANGNGVRDGDETDAHRADTDGDGLADGLEDRNRNGQVDPGEMNPRSKDTDCDGLLDGAAQGAFQGEDLNANGLVDPGETDPANRDTDGDGLLDGVERGIPANAAPVACGYPGDMDPSSSTNPLDGDQDGDGIADGAEDANQDGRVDPGELDPRDGTDGAPETPAGQACATPNLRQVLFQRDSGADLRLALRPSFQEVRPLVVGGQHRGFIGYDGEHQVSFLAYKRGRVDSSSSAVGDEAGIRARLDGVVVETTQTFTTWDGFPAVQAFYDRASTGNLRDYTNAVANALVGSGAGVLAGGAGASGPFKLQAQYVHRSDASVLVVLSIAPRALYAEQVGQKAARFVTADTAGGTALAQFGDVDAVQCESFTAGSGMADFLFVVDDSGSMADYQNALGNAATAMEARLGNSVLDWRIAMVTSSYTQAWAGNGGVLRGFTRDLRQFRAWLQQGAPCPDSKQGCWVGVQGSSEERMLESARAAVNHMADASAPEGQKLRAGAKLVVILLTDTRDQSRDTVANLTTWFKSTNPANQLIQVHGILCPPDGARCHPDEDNTSPVHQDVIQATGGIVGSIRSAQSIQNTLYTIVDSVISATGYRTLKPPIGASVRVALEGVQDASVCPAGDLPRSQRHGFDVDGVSRTLSFYGACRPAVPGTTKAAISYRYWGDRTPDRDGSPPPCSTDTAWYDVGEPDFCRGNLTCNRETNRCECPADCGGGGAPGQVCNTSREVCAFTCAADCGGTCGSFQACDTSTCSCRCVQDATCAPGFRYDASACGCVCDTAALSCGDTYQADASACACVCKPDCGGACGAGTTCNMSLCACVPDLN